MGSNINSDMVGGRNSNVRPQTAYIFLKIICTDCTALFREWSNVATVAMFNRGSLMFTKIHAHSTNKQTKNGEGVGEL